MMRDKRRYIMVRSTREIAPAEAGEFEQGLYRELIRQLGEMRYHTANPKLVRFVDSRRFILRVGLAMYPDSIAALAFIKRVNDATLGLHTLAASGTIRALQGARAAVRSPGAPNQAPPSGAPISKRL